jgi:phage tail-like protein
MIDIANLPAELINKLDVLGLEPLTAFQFALQIDGLPLGSTYLLGFNQIQGLKSALQIRSVEEGGNKHIHQFPRRIESNALVLTKGMSYSQFFWQWHNDAINWTKDAPDYRRTASVFMLHRLHLVGIDIPYEVRRWDLVGAWPSQWTGPEFNSTETKQAFESITLRYESITEGKSIFGTTGQLILDIMS